MISKFNYLSNELTPTKHKRKFSTALEGESGKRGGLRITDLQDDNRNQTYFDVLVNELMPSASTLRSPLDKTNSNSILRYSNHSPLPPWKSKQTPLHHISSSKLSLTSQMALQTPKKMTRYIPKTPYKVLDAPELHDDFYLNLVDWSSTNCLAVGLGSCVYLWSAVTGKVGRDTRADDLGRETL